MAAFQQLGPFISTFADAEEKISENEDSSCLLSESAVDDASKTPSQSAQVGEKDESGAAAKEEKVEEAEEAEEAGKALSTEGKGSDGKSSAGLSFIYLDLGQSGSGACRKFLFRNVASGKGA